MAIRTSTDNVKDLLGRAYDSDLAPSISQFIEAATVITDRVETCATNKGEGLTSAELELIERYLAAHFYLRQDRRGEAKKTDDASIKFQGKTGFNLFGTEHGQDAMDIDWSGCLRALGRGKRVGGFWLGKAPSEATAYEDRD